MTEPKTVRCPECDGDGHYDVMDWLYANGDMKCHTELCHTCEGTGKVEIEALEDTDWYD